MVREKATDTLRLALPQEDLSLFAFDWLQRDLANGIGAHLDGECEVAIAGARFDSADGQLDWLVGCEQRPCPPKTLEQAPAECGVYGGDDEVSLQGERGMEGFV